MLYEFYDCDYSMENRVEEMSLRKYNLMIGVILLWGFAVNVFMCVFFTDTFMQWNPMAILVGYFILALMGILMSKKSDSALISFIGYNLVVIPVGVVLSIFLTQFDQISILNAFMATSFVTIIMIVLSTAKPKIFLSMGKVLLIILFAVIVCELIFIFVGINIPSIWDWGVALLFCLYIGYDWAKAQELTRTMNNAVDSVVGLYLDIVNILVRILAASKDD